MTKIKKDRDMCKDCIKTFRKGWYFLNKSYSIASACMMKSNSIKSVHVLRAIQAPGSVNQSVFRDATQSAESTVVEHQLPLLLWLVVCQITDRAVVDLAV